MKDFECIHCGNKFQAVITILKGNHNIEGDGLIISTKENGWLWCKNCYHQLELNDIAFGYLKGENILQ